MRIIPLTSDHQQSIQALIAQITVFNAEEIAVLDELLDIYLFNPTQKDYYFFASQEENNELSSFICFGPTPMTQNTFDLYWIGTSPKYRRLGLAEKLINHMKEHMQEKKAKLIRIETSSEEIYQETLAFYERLNFKEAARIKDFYKDGDDLITYIVTI